MSQTTHTPIEDQISEVRRELAERRDRYAREIRHNLITPREAEDRNRRLMSALATLAIVERHADGLRTLITMLSVKAGRVVSEDELTLLLQSPAVREVVERFPDGRVVAKHPAPASAPESMATNPESSEAEA